MIADQSDRLAQEVGERVESGQPFYVRGSGSKAGLGREVVAEPIDVTGHRGIVTFEPTELVMTARAGTTLADVEAALAEAGQMLAFEPPRFDSRGTIGGAVATGLSGPRRPFAGSTRDFVLGVRLINGRGEALRFGGEVMKNVAGYDVSRLMAGAFGTLGLLLDVSLKVLPRPTVERTRVLEMERRAALAWMDRITTEPYPLSGLCHVDGQLHVRLSGTEPGVVAAERDIGGEAAPDNEFWNALRDHDHAFFGGDAPLWRIAVPTGTPDLALDARTAIDWGGTQRWLRTRADANTIRDVAKYHGGHAQRFAPLAPPGDETPFHPLTTALMPVHQRLKAAFDPDGLINPGRMYAGL
ncbi:MAG: glycolate oxidase subunit GlcE [Pseudomonadota bacterium]